MRDIIWTIIILWLILKVVDLLKKKPAKQDPGAIRNPEGSPHVNSANRNEKNALRDRLNNEGEYVDYEEVK
jgi:hypothetical protein